MDDFSADGEGFVYFQNFKVGSSSFCNFDFFLISSHISFDSSFKMVSPSDSIGKEIAQIDRVTVIRNTEREGLIRSRVKVGHQISLSLSLTF